MMTGKRTQSLDRTFIAEGAEWAVIHERESSRLLDGLLAHYPSLRRVLLIPPDFTRHESWAGVLTCQLFDKLKDRAEVVVLPALGTHDPMNDEQRKAMFPSIPADHFRIHQWREDLVRLGEVPGADVSRLSDGAVDYPIPIEINRLLLGPWDRIFSIGQLVPHEVIGIANHVKNVLVGVGGASTIHRTHYLGAVYGMERIMGRAETPVRSVLQHAMETLGGSLPLTYVLTVRGFENHRLVTRGLYAGEGTECYTLGAQLCQRVNIQYLERSPRKVVVWLDPSAYRSTWLGNKAIYRTRMAIDDGGELVVLAPGVRTFGEDPQIDRLIRKYGYRGTPRTVASVSANDDLGQNLAAAAHLIHGSSEGRFTITYCPGQLRPDEVTNVGFQYMDLNEALRLYNPDQLNDGWNTINGEEIYFIRHPGQGLWTTKERFAQA